MIFDTYEIFKNAQSEMKALKSLIIALQKQVEIAVFLNEQERIEKILIPDNYPQFTLTEKEKYIFNTLANQFILNNNNDELLKYFIYKYEISEENSLDIIAPGIKAVFEPMFELRRLNKELNINLEVNNHNQKKLKV
jgi:hypothetical protein